MVDSQVRRGTYGASPSRHFPHHRQRPARIEPQHLRQIQKLHHIHPALAALQPRDERLIFAETVGQLRLRHAGGFAALDQEGDQRLVTSGSECFCQVQSPRAASRGLQVI